MNNKKAKIENNKEIQKKKYINNRESIIKTSKEYYHNMIKNFSKKELIEFRKRKSIYFKNYYNKNKIYFVKKNENDKLAYHENVKVKKKKIKTIKEKKENIELLEETSFYFYD